eukprot:15472973-Alexandrium_andersonii.AAC.1
MLEARTPAHLGPSPLLEGCGAGHMGWEGRLDSSRVARPNMVRQQCSVGPAMGGLRSFRIGPPPEVPFFFIINQRT